MGSTTGSHDRLVLDFLAEFALDRELDRLQPMLHYLRRYPGREEAVAREYLLLQDRACAPQARSAEGERVLGDYQLLAELGRGAQGVVWLAHDRRLSRDVALKVLQPGRHAVVSPQRFRREALVAARLDHPGLATVFDAGEADGQLWLAMRYVPGLALGALLARARGAGTVHPGSGLRLAQVPEHASERDAVLAVVQMVARAARALAVAHDAGVVHRDVKPGNLLITPSGDPVLVDFGLARDHDSSAACLTRTGDQLGTPAYMAPELFAPGPAPAPGPACDLWGLAVVLYECLTRVHPFAGPSPQALQAAIREQDPTPVRRLNPAVPRGLATVVTVALDKDPRRRYASAAAFAADLERVAAGEPPLCRPPGPVARTVRISRRHPAASVAALLCVVFLAVAFAQLESARRTEADLRGRATARAADLRRLARSLLFELHAAVRDLPGATEVNRALVARALEYLELLRGEAGDDPSLRADVAQAYLQIGDVLGNPRHPNLGRPRDARRYYQDAATLLAGLAGSADQDRLRAQCLLRLGELDEHEHALDAAVRAWRLALSLLPAAPAGAPGDAEARTLAVTLHLRLGESLGWASDEPGRVEAARAEFRAALALAPADGAGPSADPVAQAEVQVALARASLTVGDLAGARAAATTARTLLAALPAGRRLHLTIRCLAGALDGVLGAVEHRSGKPASALDLLARASAALGELGALDPQNEQAVRLRIQALLDLSFVHMDQERHPQAQEALTTALSLVEQCGDRFGSDWVEERRADCQSRLGQIAYLGLDYPTAIRLYQEALATQRRRSAARPDDVRLAGKQALAELRLGWVLVRSQRLEAGRRTLDSARAALAALLARDPSVKAWRDGIVAAHQQMAEIAFQGGQFEAAAASYAAALTAQREDGAGPDPQRSMAVLLQGLAEANCQLRRHDEARRHAGEAVAILRELSASTPQDRYVARLLATALTGLGRHQHLGGDPVAALASERQALALLAQLEQGTDSDTPRLVLTRVMALAMIARLELDRGGRDAAVATARSARAELARLPTAQQRLQDQYAQILAAVEQELAAR